MMCITGKTVEELEKGLESLKVALRSGAKMGVGGETYADVNDGLNAMKNAMGYIPRVETPKPKKSAEQIYYTLEEVRAILGK